MTFWETQQEQMLTERRVRDRVGRSRLEKAEVICPLPLRGVPGEGYLLKVKEKLVHGREEKTLPGLSTWGKWKRYLKGLKTPSWKLVV